MSTWHVRKLPIIALILLLTGASTQPAQRLVLSTIADPKSFNPVLAKETSTTAVTGLIFEGLTRTNGVTTEVEPNLAESWEVSEDGLTWTIRLRKDVSWSDGQPLSPDDVIFTYNRLIYNDSIPSSARDIWMVDGKKCEVTTAGDDAVIFRLPVKFAPFLELLATEILPRHKLEKVVDAGEFNHHWGVDSKPSDIVGTGPFVLERYVAGERVTMKRNPRYWRRDREGKQQPYLEEITFLIVPDITAAFLKFQLGEIDSYGMRGSDYPLLKPGEKEGNYTVYRLGPQMGSNYLVLNQNRGTGGDTPAPGADPTRLSWFTNLSFRRAIAHAIDRQAMIDIVMNGLGYPQNGPMTPSEGFFYNPGVPAYQYDPAKAREILKEAGFVDKDGDGIIDDPAGNRVEFSLYTNSGNTDRVKMAEIIRKDLEEIGMKVNFTQLEFNTLVAKLDAGTGWDAVVLGLTGGIEPHWGYNVWKSSGQLHMWYPRQPQPATPWEARIDQLFAQAVQELDRQKRKALYDEWQKIVAEQLPFIYTVTAESLIAVRNKFGNLKPTAYGGAWHNIEEIYVTQ